MTSDDRRENELIADAVNGDRAALERLMLDHYTPLANWIRSIPWRPRDEVAEVDDVVQQTFALVFQRISQFEPRDETPFFAWLTTIAENQLRDAIRFQQRQKRGGGRKRIRSTAGEGSDSAVELIDLLMGDLHTPSKSIARREAIQAMQIAIAGLNDEYRQAVQLRYVEGHSLEETARLMGRTTGAVRGLLDRAKKKMREALGRASLYLSRK